MERTPTHFRGGSGEPLVVIHGFSHLWEVWEPVLEALCERHDVLAPTIAGHLDGALLDEGTEPTADALVDVLERQMDEAGFERAHIAGNSLGGWFALELAKRGRAHSVVTLSPGGGWAHGSRAERGVKRIFNVGGHVYPRLDRYMERLVRRPGLRRLLMSSAMEHPERLKPHQALRLIRGTAGCSIYWDFMAAALRDGPATGLGAIDVPVLLTWAEHDKVLPVDGCSEGLVRQMPNAEWRILEGVGHVPMFDDPELVTRTILEWTGKHPMDVREEASTVAGP